MSKETKPVREMRQIMEIEDALEVVYTAHCDECAVDYNNNTSSDDIAEKLHKLGWRCDPEGTLYCPDCAKQRKIK